MKFVFFFTAIWLSFTIGRGWDTENPAGVSLALATEQIGNLAQTTKNIVKAAQQ